ncbi:MAG: hypothetical protein ABI175_09455 [Polyangiales bacterium]
MSVRSLRRTFATPFVVTLAAIPACVVQSAPPRSGPPVSQPAPQPSEPAQPTPAQPTDTKVVAISNPPRPGTEQATPPKEEPAKFERHWTVMKLDGKCLAYAQSSCPAGATCNPPPPSNYTCTPDVTDGMKIVQWANTVGCHVETPAPPCPPKTMCNPPRPRAVPCPQ